MALPAFCASQVRAMFPALADGAGPTPRIFFDNPAGTQVPQQVIERMNRAMVSQNANLGGFFETSVAAEKLIEEARQAMAEFYNAASPREIIFGQNMTTLTLHLSRGLAKNLAPGDEIILSRMDHDANVSPWLAIAKDMDLKVRWLDFDLETFEFAGDALDQVLSDKTRLLAVGYASNCTGTINDIRALSAKARAAGALVYVDAVQLAPHNVIDVQALGCDFLVSSAYKFFGPHQGVLWGRADVLERIFAYKLRPASDDIPEKFETGTLAREGLAGVLGAVEYFAGIGRAGSSAGMSNRQAIAAAFDVLGEYENALTGRLLEGLADFSGLSIHGITNPNRLHARVPTVSFTISGHHPDELARKLALENIFVWSGHNYAVEPVTRLGLMEAGGVVRVGIAHYNTMQEVERFLATLAAITGQT